MKAKHSYAGPKSSTLAVAGLICCVWFLPVTSSEAQEIPVPRLERPPQAPPPSPPVQTRIVKPTPEGPISKGDTLYSIGQPTDEEQLYLEYINRSRADPPAEGVRLANTLDPEVLSAYASFGVNLAQMQAEFNTNVPAPPLAMNAQLLAAARLHSGDMFTNQFQGHFGTNGWDPGQRITAQGYSWSTYGENVFSYAESVFHGHAGFNVDWGAGPGGMQNPRGHRNNIHNANFREVGVGVVNGVNGTVGPQLVTQDFATRQSATPLITGVAYYDFNGNNFYDLGEGIGGVTINVPGSSFYAVTSESGGYAVPGTTNGNYSVTFSASGLSPTQRVATVSSLKNIKLDYVPAYSPPVISGPNPASVNQSNLYTFTAVGAATAYQWEQTRRSPYTAVEGAESGLANVTVVSSPGYSVLASDVHASGSYSFHLTQPDAADQFLTLNAVIQPSANSQLTFAKRLGYASTAQIARAQVSTNGGATWQEVWSKPGTGGSGEANFTRITNSLSSYAGQTLKVRFVYDFIGGSYYFQTSTGFGFYLDDIAVSNADQLVNQITNGVQAGTAFLFNPTNTGDYLLRVRAQIGSRTLNWGPAVRVTAPTAPPSLQFVGNPVLSGNQIQLDFNVANYRTGMTFELWKASDPAGSWTLDNSVSFQTLIPNSKFRATTSTGGSSKGYYRVRGNYPP